MNEALAELLPLVNASLWHGFVVFVRVAAIVSMLPAFGEQSVPVRIKLGIALAFVLIVAPAIASVPQPDALGGVIRIIFTEVLAGLILGLGIRLFVLALQTAGSIAAQVTSLSQILGGAVADPLPALGYTLIIGGLALAVMTGLHVKAAEFVILSYEMLPTGRFPSGSVVSEWGVMQVAHAFELAFTLAMPFVIVSVIYNLTLGVINKAMPQLMVAFVGAPVITFAGLLILFLAAPMILTIWLAALDRYMANPFAVPQ
ncbi:MAG: flagellar biosynthetic protein FliR [Pseudomonadota bacterium]